MTEKRQGEQKWPKLGGDGNSKEAASTFLRASWNLAKAVCRDSSKALKGAAHLGAEGIKAAWKAAKSVCVSVGKGAVRFARWGLRTTSNGANFVYHQVKEAAKDPENIKGLGILTEGIAIGTFGVGVMDAVLTKRPPETIYINLAAGIFSLGACVRFIGSHLSKKNSAPHSKKNSVRHYRLQ